MGAHPRKASPPSSQHTVAAPCCPRMSRPHVLRRKCHNLSVEPARLGTGHVEVGRASKKQILGDFQLQGMPSAERPALTPSLPMGMIYGPNDCHCLVFPPSPCPAPHTHLIAPRGLAEAASWPSQASYHLTMSQIWAPSLETALNGAAACWRTASRCRGRWRERTPRSEGRKEGQEEKYP